MAADPLPAPLGDAVRSALFERRVVLVRGALDQAAASEAAAELMTLDALGDGPVQLHLSCPSGPVDAAFVLTDVIEVLGVPVHTTALGLVGGGPVAVLAVGARRQVAPHARLHLRAPDTALEARAATVAAAAAAATAEWDRFVALLARCTGRPPADVRAEWEAGRFLDAAGAVAAGYADALTTAGGAARG